MLGSNEMKTSRLILILLLVCSLSVVTGIVGIILPIDLAYKEYFVSLILLLPFIPFRKLNNPSGFELKFFSLFLMVQLCGILSFYYNYEKLNFLGISTFFSTVVWMIAWLQTRDYHKKLFDYYLILVKIILLSSFLVLILDVTAILNVYKFSLPSYFDMGFKNKYLINGNEDVYSVVFNHVVIMKNYIKPIPFLDNIVTYCGISYEPHLFGITTAPALYVFVKQKKVWWTLLTFIMLLASFSVANILGMLTSLLFIINSRQMILIICIILLSLLIFNFGNILREASFFLWIIDKFNSRSGEDINNVFVFLTNWKNYVGEGIYNNDMSRGVGLLSGIFISLFFLLIIIEIYKKLKTNSYVAAVTLYLLIHSLKFPINIFFQPFILFIITIFIKYDGFIQKNTFE